MNQHRGSGFTLVEVLIVLLIASIMTAIAAPSFNNLIQNSRMTNQVNDLIASLYLARSEAAKTSLPTVVCHSADPFAASGSLSCGGSWSDGWIVFTDANTNNAFDDGTDTLLSRHEPLPESLTMQANNDFENMINYRTSGRAESDKTTLGTGTFLICDDRGASHAKRIIISATGRPRVDDGEGGGLTC